MKYVIADRRLYVRIRPSVCRRVRWWELWHFIAASFLDAEVIE